MSRSFVYEPSWRVLVCVDCGYCLFPSIDVWKRHMWAAPHRIFGQQLSSLVELFSTYDLAHPHEVRSPKSGSAPLPGLKCYDGFACTLCSSGLTRSQRTIKDHISKEHGKKPAEYKREPLWTKCTLQTFFAEKRFISYFIVLPTGKKGEVASGTDVDENARICRREQEDEFFVRLEEDARQADRDAFEDANRIHGFDEHRSAVVPWLVKTGIAEHIRGLKKDEIQASIALPKKATGRENKKGGERVTDDENVLVTVLACMEHIFREAHSWCFDGPQCMLTWPRQIILSRFQSSQVEQLGKTRGFEPRKEASTLTRNFGLFKQFLVYLYSLTNGDSRFFSKDDDALYGPEDVIQLTGDQDQAWKDVIRAAQSCSDGDDDPTLKTSLVQLCMRFICHDTGTRRYSSPFVSFCAMLSVKPSTRTWKEPNNFNSCLSGLIWVVQLLIFYHCAREELKEKRVGATTTLMKELCERYLQQTAESPVGEILRWRLLLFKISSEDVGNNQSRWDTDEKVLTYRDTRLHMDQVPKLLLSEYRRAYRLLYQELLFGCGDIPRAHAWALKDNLDVDAFGWYFGLHRENAGLIKKQGRALRVAIRNSDRLRASFLTWAKDGDAGSVLWREKAIAMYEASVDEFLKSLAVLFHMSAGQPLREPEFFSMTWRNSERQRAIVLEHDRVMIHTTYHKRQQQTGSFRDNIRFLPTAIGELYLDYITCVIPLRQSFLRQTEPKALISHYLWTKDGKVWPDNRLTRCMEAACTRAEVPRLHISNWRQMTVAIVKTKFAADIAYFDVEDAPEGEDAEEPDEDVRVMTRQRNHTCRTANRAYANGNGVNFGNVWDGMIRRGLHASTLWKDFWELDPLFASAAYNKRVRQEEDGSSVLAKKVAAGLYRPKKGWSNGELLDFARKLYQNDKLSWRSRAQERALSAVMSPTENVVIILPTGSGKSLCYMLPSSLPDSRVTALILPLVSLRTDMFRRFEELGIQYIQWLPGEKRDAPLVVLTAEAACSKEFMVYGQSLIAQQVLERIVIDECHYTVTAAGYRDSMQELPMIRMLRTQFVYLTATLPPTLQEAFEYRNHLKNPMVVRCSSNRSNIFFMIRRAESPGCLLKLAASEVKAAWQDSGYFEHKRDKIIIYVRERSDAEELAGMLCCPFYHRKVGNAEEKEKIIEQWVQGEEPYIVATSALSSGFDHPHIRLVLHVGEPYSMVDFAQEFGRAGRDGRQAYSFVLLPHGWRPPRYRPMGEGERDLCKEAMYRYLEGKDCLRGYLSEYLDEARDRRRRCISDEDVACDVCKRGKRVDGCEEEEEEEEKEIQEIVETSTEFGFEHTGEALIAERHQQNGLAIEEYEEKLRIVSGSCMLCRGLGVGWDHEFESCSRRYEVFQARNRVRLKLKEKGRSWVAAYRGCFWCYNPQRICGRADMERGIKECRYKDIVLPLCYGIYVGGGLGEWLEKEFGVRFKEIDLYIEWLGKGAEIGGEKTINAVKVAAAGLRLLVSV